MNGNVSDEVTGFCIMARKPIVTCEYFTCHFQPSS